VQVGFVGVGTRTDNAGDACDDPGSVPLVLHSGQWVRWRGQGYWRVGRRLSIEVVSMDEDTGKAATAHEADDLIFVVVAKMDSRVGTCVKE
jgi:hypothetical protein